ncbi:hydantoinase/oxoprolinase family protein [Pararhodobacter sp. CCB-MM2]|uniref:hydantoinase/oxoprolinase family protein n=1 Tax=Pararhodobacter sp. CCB-MM2 TaxID=1786003 RepID=UPI0008378639|nr:hydantoinase/oxoprolinase family protein [Pararhodobacter sp. CCB-MM2]
MTTTYRLGADIGGTFTDVVLRGDDETIHQCKVSSTPADYSLGILNGAQELLARVGADPAQVSEIIHATTVATNTVLEGKGAKTALVTTRGFRDVVEIGRLRVPQLYDLNYVKPVPLARRRHRYEVSERMLADGSVLVPLAEAELAGIAAEILAAGIEAVAISFLHSYANPDHEARAFALLADALGPEIYLTRSTEVLPEIREYERTSTVVVNAYLGPVVKRYLLSLERRLAGAGLGAPLSIVQSSGGAMRARAAAETPAAIIESGPAAGVIAAANLGRAAGYGEIITFDMGGTTAKAAMIEGGEPTRTTEYEVGAGINLSSKLVKGGGHSVKMPFIDVSEIGAGGGSIVRLDAGGALRVGPDSAGSSPGPACYDTGGEDPTFTDAAVVLGYLNPAHLAGGAVALKAAKAQEALQTRVATPAGLTLDQAASGVYAIAAATMMRAVKAVSTYRGRDPRDFTLFAFGGNGPLVAVQVAAMLDMGRVVVPPSPGVFSAMGLLHSQTRRELTRTVYRPLAALTPEALHQGLDALQVSVSQALTDEGCPPEAMRFQIEADLRYVGQAYELTVPVSAEAPEAILQSLGTAFHAEHARTYGHASDDDPVELVNLRLIGLRADSGDRTFRAPPLGTPARGTHHRNVHFEALGARVATPILTRADLAGGRRLGPLIVEEYDSTTVVPPGWGAELDAFTNIVLTKEA